jgi:hypothetical protein
MDEAKREPSEKEGSAKKKPLKASEKHLEIMAEYIFKREGRSATLGEAQDALNNLTRLMKWLYEHRNDLRKREP